VPCADAKLVPAISATVATDIIKRLVIELSPHDCIARADNERKWGLFPVIRKFQWLCFVHGIDARHRMHEKSRLQRNRLFQIDLENKRGDDQTREMFLNTSPCRNGRRRSFP
jgi:hypothetical protein